MTYCLIVECRHAVTTGRYFLVIVRYFLIKKPVFCLHYLMNRAETKLIFNWKIKKSFIKCFMEIKRHAGRRQKEFCGGQSRIC